MRAESCQDYLFIQQILDYLPSGVFCPGVTAVYKTELCSRKKCNKLGELEAESGNLKGEKQNRFCALVILRSG